MINIYCLVDPFDNKPFYVGATKYDLNKRLSEHIGDSKGRANERSNKIMDIRAKGKRPRIRLIMSVERIAVNHYEQFCYDMLKKQGFKLLNASTRFVYFEAKTNSRWNNFGHMNSNLCRDISVHPIYFTANHNRLGINHVIVYLSSVNH